MNILELSRKEKRKLALDLLTEYLNEPFTNGTEAELDDCIDSIAEEIADIVAWYKAMKVIMDMRKQEEGEEAEVIR